MSMIYSDPKRESETYALPDIEVFYADAGTLEWEGQEEPSEAGWYFWTCFPGCLPDSDPTGPYKTKRAAERAARDLYSE